MTPLTYLTWIRRMARATAISELAAARKSLARAEVAARQASARSSALVRASHKARSALLKRDLRDMEKIRRDAAWVRANPNEARIRLTRALRAEEIAARYLVERKRRVTVALSPTRKGATDRALRHPCPLPLLRGPGCSHHDGAIELEPGRTWTWVSATAEGSLVVDGEAHGVEAFSLITPSGRFGLGAHAPSLSVLELGYRASAALDAGRSWSAAVQK